MQSSTHGDDAAVRNAKQCREKTHLSEELHDSLVLPEVLVSFQEENVVTPVLPLHADLTRPLLGGYHLLITSDE